MFLWVSAGRWELMVVSGCSACLCNSCSGLRLWIPAIGEPTEGNGFLIPSIFHRVQYWTSFLTIRGHRET
jgi:hypothetical protein